MYRGRSTFDDQSGWTLVELLVVIGVIVIVSTMALMQRGNSNEQFKRQNISWGLKNAFERARFDSVKRRPNNTGTDLYAFVTVANKSYTLTADRNSDGKLMNNDPVVTNFAGENITIQYLATPPTSVNMPASVVFNTRGEPTALGANSAPVAPVFLICNGTCAGGRSAANSDIVLVTPSGTVNILPGNSAVPAFGIPAVSDVPVTDDINVLLSDIGTGPNPVPTVAPSPGPPPTPTPVPSVTPTPVPTATPTPGPSATPTPTATPTPSPTATPTPTPTPTITPTPTPVPPCVITAPSSVSYGNNGPQTISIGFANSTGSTISITKNGGPDNWAFSPGSVTPLGSSGSFNVTFTYANGSSSLGNGSFTISGCGSAVTVSVTVTNH